MPAIPQYERRVLEQGVTGGARGGAAQQGAEEWQGLQNLGNAGVQLATRALHDQERVEKEKNANLDAIQVANLLSERQVFDQEDFARRSQAWKPGMPDMREDIGKSYDTWVTENESKLNTDAGKRYLREHAINMKTRQQTGAFKFQETSISDAMNVQTAQGIETDKKIVYADPTQARDVLTRRLQTIGARTDLTEAEKLKMGHQLTQEISHSVELGELTRSPAAWLAKNVGRSVAVAASAAPGGGVSLANSIHAQESNSGKMDTSGVNSQNVTGPMQMHEGTFIEAKRLGLVPQNYDWKNPAHNTEAGFAWVDHLQKKHGGDPARAAAEYYAGPKAVNADGSINRHYRNLKRPNDPTVGEYVDKVVGRIGGSAGAGSTKYETVAPEQRSETFNNLTLEQQNQLVQLAETRTKQAQAQYRGTLDSKLMNATAMHADGKPDPYNLSAQDFTLAYGDEGGAKYTEYKASQAMGADIGKFSTMSAQEINITIAQSQSGVDGLAAEAGDGYKLADDRQKMRMQAAAQVMKARNDDPVAYSLRSNPELRQIQEVAMQTQGLGRKNAIAQWVTASLAEQQRLGVASPRVLSTSQAEAIGKMAMNMSKPDDAAKLIGGLEAEYGDYFPKVFQELVREGKIAGEMQIIPNLPSATAREAVSRLARVKEADLVQGIDSDAQRTVKDSVVEKLSEFSRAVPLMSQQSQGVVNSYETTLRKMAYQAIQMGTSPGDAVEQAHKLLLGHYTFDGTMRIPTDRDASKVKAGAALVLKAGLEGVDAPPDVAGGRNPDAVGVEWVRTVQANPVWFTSDTDGGLELWASGNNGSRYRVTRSGFPVRYTWDQLTAMQTAEVESKRTTGLDARGRMATYREQRRIENQKFNEQFGAQ